MKPARILFLFSLALCLAIPGLAAAQGVEFTSAAESITIGATYNGTVLHVEGQAPAGSQVVLRFSGQPGQVAVKQKGKALGLLWMNMDTLHFSGVPGVCLVESPAGLDALGAAGAALGLEGVARNVEVEPATADRSALLPELLKLKKGEGLYREGAGHVAMGQVEGERQRFSADFPVPSRLSPGEYTLEAVAVKDGAVAGQTSRAVEAKLVGFPSLLADLAFGHALWYGVLSSIIAIIAGLCIGLVFQSKGAH
jgi:hypothetical protein